MDADHTGGSHGSGADHLFGRQFRATTLLKRAQGVDTWRGVDLDGRDVIIKTTSARVAHKWLEFEVDVLNGLGRATTATPIRASIDDATLSLTRPFIRGPTLADHLAQHAAEVADVTAMAIALLGTLDELHARGVVHGDIKPSNIVLPDAWSAPVLVDFGLARHRLLGDSLAEVPIDAIRYLAPEQAGLLKRGVDARADLYALGIAMYEAVARPPFSGRSVSELLRHQLTLSPAPLDALVPGVPRGFDRIVTRLLRKDPRDRYQTARGVRADLEELAGVLARGQSGYDLVVGVHDPRDSIAEPAFTGRSAELVTLGGAVGDALVGRGGVVIVEGESGSGKTWLLEELARRATQQGAWVLRGHGLAQVAQQPFQVLSAIARDIAVTTASESARTARVTMRTGSVGGAIAAALPAMQAVVGGPGISLEPNAEQRSVAALSVLLDALGSDGEAAVLLIDDAQWADALTLQLLERWQAEAPPRRHTVVVLAFRAEEVDDAHPLRRIAARAHVRLGPLRDEEVRQQIASMAGELPAAAVELVIARAAGNPFLVSAVLLGLVESGALSHGAAGWQLEPAADPQVSQVSQVGGQLADVLAARIERLAEPVRRLLAVGALLGRTFDPMLAGELCGLAARDAALAMHELRGRLLWIDGGPTTCTFLHDQIREALLADIPPPERRRLHLRAAERLASSGRPFELAYHYDAAGEPVRALPHAVRAAEAAAAQHDMALAERYYRMALRGLANADGALRYRVVRGLGEALLVRSSYDDCARFLDEAFQLASDDAMRADVEERRAQLALKRGHLPDAIGHGEHALRLVGRYVPRSALMCFAIVLWEVVVQALHTRFPRAFVGRRSLAGADREMFAIRVYNGLNGPYFFARGAAWMLWAHLRALNLVERYPPTPARGREYGVHGSACAGFPSLFERAIRYTRRGAAICAAHHDPWGQARAMQFLALNLCATGRYQEAVEAAEDGGRLFDRAGDAWEAQGALNWGALARYRMGDLAGAADAAKKLHERGKRLDSPLGTAFALDAWVRAVEGNLPAPLIHDELGRGKDHVQTSSVVAQAEAIRLLAHGQPAEAEALLETWLGRMRRERAFFHESNVSMIVYLAAAQRQRAMAVAVAHPAASARLLARARRTSHKAVRVVRRFRNCMPHALREAALVEAMAGELGEARLLIDASIRIAAQLGARFELALSREVRGELGPTLRGSAAAHALESARSELFAMRAALGDAPARVTISLIDRFGAVLAAGHRIARSLVADEVLTALREGALSLLRALHCAIVDLGVDLRVDLGSDLDGEPRIIHGDAAAVSPALLAALRRTGQVVVWTGAPDDATLVRAAVRSALCAPIVVRGELSAALYATHTEVTTFGDEEQRIAGFLVALAGAALENAAGFLQVQELSQVLERRVDDRTQELAAANAALEGSLRQLKDTQDQLLHAGRMAAVGTLIAGLSHELNNPLAVILGNIENLRTLTPADADKRVLRMIGAIDRQAKRAAGLVNGLLGFSHSGGGARDAIIPEDLIRLVVDLVTPEARRREIALRVYIADGLAPVLVARHEIESALVNIVTNALQASREGAEVELSAAIEPLDGVPGVRFRVRDHGTGIPPEILPQIFDPFFTTKPEGEGTGLGLSLARTIADAHGGQLTVDSVVGRGTLMTLWLPSDTR